MQQKVGILRTSLYLRASRLLFNWPILCMLFQAAGTALESSYIPGNRSAGVWRELHKKVNNDFLFRRRALTAFVPSAKDQKQRQSPLGGRPVMKNSCIIVVFDRRRLFTIFCVHKRFSLCANCLQWQHFVSLHSCRSFLCFWALLFLALTGLPEFINCRQLVVCCPLLDATYMGAHPPTYTPNCPGDLVHFFLLGITTI